MWLGTALELVAGYPNSLLRRSRRGGRGVQPPLVVALAVFLAEPIGKPRVLLAYTVRVRLALVVAAHDTFTFLLTLLEVSAALLNETCIWYVPALTRLPLLLR